MVKNPFKRKKKKNPFEASLLVDNPDIKVVEARFNEKPFLIAVGKSEQREKKVVGEVRLPRIGKGEYQSQKDMKWQVLYNRNALPSGFMPEERLKDWAASTTSAVSGSIEVFNSDTKFIETDLVKLDATHRLDRDPNQWLSEEWWKSMTREDPKKKKPKSKQK